MYNFFSFVYLGQVFFRFSIPVPIALFYLSTQLLTDELICQINYLNYNMYIYTINGYNALKSIDFINFVNVLMCFLVSRSSGGGQVSPVPTMAFRRILLSLSSCVQLKIIWLIVCSSSPQVHVELGMIWNLQRHDLVKP